MKRVTNLARATIIITRVQEGFKAPLLSLLLPTDGECVFFGIKGQADGRVDLFLRCGKMGFLCTRMCNEAQRVGVKMFVLGFIRRRFSHRSTYLRSAKVGEIMQNVIIRNLSKPGNSYDEIKGRREN